MCEMFYLSFAFKLDVSNVENMTNAFEKCPIKEEYKPEFKKNYGGWA